MQPLHTTTERPPKRNKPRPWVLTYVLLPIREGTDSTIKPIHIKERYPTEKSAQQALEVVQRGAGMWRKDLWEAGAWRIEHRNLGSIPPFTRYIGAGKPTPPNV